MNSIIVKTLEKMLEPVATAAEDQGLNKIFDTDTTPEKTRYKSIIAGGISFAEGLKTAVPAGSAGYSLLSAIEQECKDNLASHSLTL
jgi:phosphoribosylanthranilate isomerase